MKIHCLAVTLASALAACQPASETGAPSAGAEVLAVTPERLQALTTEVLTLVRADESCVLPEKMERERTAQAVDLGGGDAAVLVVCSTGTADQWSRVYVSQEGDAPMPMPLPLYKYQGAEGWLTWESMSNMAWTPGEGFAGSTRHQASGCAEGAGWSWEGGRFVLVKQWHMDCAAIGPEGELPDPIQDFPTTPSTEQPTAIAPQA